MNVRKMIKCLQAAGKSIIPQRKLLLRIINRNAHLDATEISGLAKGQDLKISPFTVYRTVNLFKEVGLVEASDLREDCYLCEVPLLENHYLHLRQGQQIPRVVALKKPSEKKDFEERRLPKPVYRGSSNGSLRRLGI